MCEFFGVSRAAYYAWVDKLEAPDPDQERMDQVQAAYEGSHKSYGYRRLTLHLQKKMGLSINHKAVLRLMRKLGIRSCARKPKMYKKLEEIGTYHRYSNVLHRDFVVSGVDTLDDRTLQGLGASTGQPLDHGFRFDEHHRLSRPRRL